jgi:hypothetical protein
MVASMKPEIIPGSQAAYPKKKGLSTSWKIAIWVAVVIVVFEGGGIAYYAVTSYEPPLPISTMAEHPWGIGLSPQIEIIPSTIDPNALEGVLGGNNMKTMTAAEYAISGPELVENGHLNIPLAMEFVDNTPRTLHYKFSEDPMDGSNTFLTIDGLKAGDVLLSPIDGTIRITRGNRNLTIFSLITQDPAGNKVTIIYSTDGLKSLLGSDVPVGKEDILIPIKAGDPIGSLITSGQLRIAGYDFGTLPAIATTANGKAIQLVG